MPQKKCRVELVASTPNPMAVIYAAFRQCYHAGFVGDMHTKLLDGEISAEKQEALIRNVLKSGHTSPIEHVSFTFAIEGVSRALTHQLVRHRIASFSQQSQRYVDGSNFDYILPPAFAKIPEAQERFEAFMKEVGSAYQDLKKILDDNGRGEKSKEDARFVLPQAAESKIVVTMNCRSLINFFEHRCCTRAQWEIRLMAMQMLKLCRKELPVIFENAGARCERLKYCPEGEKFTCGRYPLPE